MLAAPGLAEPPPVSHAGVALQLAATQADVVVIGTVVAVDSEFTPARPLSGGAADQQVGWTTATVKIGAALIGAKGKTHLRVGWLPGQSYDSAASEPRRAALRRPGGCGTMDGIGEGEPITLSEGQEACLLLTPHPDGGFYVPTLSVAPLVKGRGNYDADLETVVKVVSVVKDPTAALAAKEANDRDFAATTLVRRYRTQLASGRRPYCHAGADPRRREQTDPRRTGGNRLEQVQRVRQQPRPGRVRPAGATDRDGWTPPAIADDQDRVAVMSAAVKKWLAGHAGTFAIRRYVVEPASPKKR